MHVEVRLGFSLYVIPGTIVPEMVCIKGQWVSGINLERISIPEIDGKTDVPFMIEFIEYAINEGGVDKEIRSLTDSETGEPLEPPVVFSWRLVATESELKELVGVESVKDYKYI